MVKELPKDSGLIGNSLGQRILERHRPLTPIRVACRAECECRYFSGSLAATLSAQDRSCADVEGPIGAEHNAIVRLRGRSGNETVVNVLENSLNRSLQRRPKPAATLCADAEAIAWSHLQHVDFANVAITVEARVTGRRGQSTQPARGLENVALHRP